MLWLGGEDLRGGHRRLATVIIELCSGAMYRGTQYIGNDRWRIDCLVSCVGQSRLLAAS